MGFRYGFAGAVPGIIAGLASFVVGSTGFMIGPLRKARVITVPEMLERRFGKRVRWLAGLVVALGGLLNMGIFLRLGGEFLVHATGLNPAYLKVTMVALLAVAVLYTMVGGMVAVVVTNYLQFLVLGVGMLTISAMVVWQTSWTELTKELRTAYRVGVDYRQHEDVQQKIGSRSHRRDGRKRGARGGRQSSRRICANRKERRCAKTAGNSRRSTSWSTRPPPRRRALTMGNPVNPAARKGSVWHG